MSFYPKFKYRLKIHSIRINTLIAEYKDLKYSLMLKNMQKTKHVEFNNVIICVEDEILFTIFVKQTNNNIIRKVSLSLDANWKVFKQYRPKYPVRNMTKHINVFDIYATFIACKKSYHNLTYIETLEFDFDSYIKFESQNDLEAKIKEIKRSKSYSVANDFIYRLILRNKLLDEIFEIAKTDIISNRIFKTICVHQKCNISDLVKAKAESTDLFSRLFKSIICDQLQAIFNKFIKFSEYNTCDYFEETGDLPIYSSELLEFIDFLNTLSMEKAINEGRENELTELFTWVLSREYRNALDFIESKSETILKTFTICSMPSSEQLYVIDDLFCYLYAPNK